MEIQFTREQIRNLVEHLESHMTTHNIGFTDTSNPIASIFCAIQFGNEFMNSEDKGALKEY